MRLLGYPGWFARAVAMVHSVVAKVLLCSC